MLLINLLPVKNVWRRPIKALDDTENLQSVLCLHKTYNIPTVYGSPVNVIQSEEDRHSGHLHRHGLQFYKDFLGSSFWRSSGSSIEMSIRLPLETPFILLIGTPQRQPIDDQKTSIDYLNTVSVDDLKDVVRRKYINLYISVNSLRLTVHSFGILSYCFYFPSLFHFKLFEKYSFAKFTINHGKQIRICYKISQKHLLTKRTTKKKNRNFSNIFCCICLRNCQVQ